MKSYLAVNVLEGTSLGRFTTYAEAVSATAHLPCVDIQYRPRSK